MECRVNMFLHSLIPPLPLPFNSRSGKSPLLVCSTETEGVEPGSEEMEQLFLRPDSGLDGEFGNGTSGMTPQPSPIPNPSRSLVPGLRYKNLGKSGLRVSNLGLATWMLAAESTETLENVVTLAYESGINVFDLSEAYSGPGAEIELGKIIKKKNWRRTSFVLSVKIYWTSK
jgi:hypothetical protein